MTISEKPADLPKEFDIVIAGGGTAACTLAGRLSVADPSLSILLIEGGRNNKDDPTIRNPAIYLSHLAPDSKTAIFYKGQASKDLAGREPIVPCGGILGGGSSINFMMYTRAAKVDYDAWNTKGWSSDDLLPLLKKTVTFHTNNPAIDKSLHGESGPVHVSQSTHTAEDASNQVLRVADALGDPTIADLQDMTSCGGFSRWSKWVSPDGKRQDAAHCFIHPLLDDGKHPNLHVLLESKVVKVEFEGKRATGVQFVPNPDFQSEIALSKPVPQTVKARKLVVVSAGALGTPQILERSGVGNKHILDKLDIPNIVDLPGVGENYMDHHLSLNPYKTSLKPDETIDGLLSGRVDFMKAVKEGNKLLGWNAIDVCSKIRPTDVEVQQLGPEFSEVWEREYKNVPSRPMMLTGVVSSFLGDPTLVDQPRQYCTMGSYTAYPQSRGSIHITGKDVTSPYEFHTGFLSHPADLAAQVWSYKKTREIARRLDYYQGEVALGHPKFPEGSKAALVSLDGKTSAENYQVNGAGRAGIKNIEYSKEDDAAIEQWIRENVNTTWHSCGTCAMKPRDKGGVVDKDLNVYGVENLKICDLSMMPNNVGANTNSTAFVVGEKGATIIAAELGLKNF